MATKSRSAIISDMEDYIARNGAVFGEWYVGVTGNPKSRLFTQHKLKEKGDIWICRHARDEYEAHEVAEYFRTTRRTKGAATESVEGNQYVYTYKMRSHTKP